MRRAEEDKPTFLSLFSGVGGFDAGLERAGWRCVGQVEIDPFCNRVLARHWPDVPRWGDVRRLQPSDLPAADLVCFGSPCQGLSVAGQRRGLHDDERSALFFEAARLVAALRPALALWENVPGVLSSGDRWDFAAALDALADAGALDLAWRTLDSRWFGVPQRRRRVFVVGDFGAERAGAVFAEPPRRAGHPAPRSEAGESVAHGLRSGAGGGRTSDDPDRTTYALTARQTRLAGEETFVVRTNQTGARGSNVWSDVAPTLDTLEPAAVTVLAQNGSDVQIGHELGALTSGQAKQIGGDLIAFHAQGGTHSLAVGVDEAPTLKVGSGSNAGHQTAIAFAWQQGDDSKHGADGRGRSWVARAGDYTGALTETRQDAVAIAGTLGAHSGRHTSGLKNEADLLAYTINDKPMPHASLDIAAALDQNGGKSGATQSVALGSLVRRLTPTECERLQGFDDGWTCLCGVEPYSTATCRCPDSPRYAALGNAVTVNVAEWLGRRLRRALLAQMGDD